MSQQSLRKRLEFFTIVVVLITISIFLIVFLLNKAQSEKQLVSSMVSEEKAISKIVISRAQEAMEKNIFSFTRDSKLIKAIKTSDIEGISARVSTTSNLLEATGVVSNIRVYSPQMKLLFTRDPADKNVEPVSLVKLAANEMMLKRGLERIGSNQVEVHFAFPIAPKGQLLAVVDLALSYSQLLKEMAEAGEVDLAMYDISGKLIVESKKGFAKSVSEIGFDVKGSSIGDLRQDGRAYNIASSKLMDSNGNHIGYTVLSADETEMKEAADITFIGGALTVLFWLAIAYFMINRMMLNAFKPLVSMQKAVETIKESGSLNTRIPVSNRNEIGVAAESINELIQLVEEAFNRSNSVMNAVASGDFTQKIDGQYVGEFATLQTAVNESTASVAHMMDELNKVVVALKAGDLSVRMDNSVQGEIRTNVDNAMNSINEVISDINKVLDYMAQGDFNHQVQAQAQGEFKRLADSVNVRVQQTYAALDDISDVIEGMSKGDLTRQVKGQYEGMFGNVADLLSRSTQSLSGLVGQTTSGVGSLVDNVNQIHQGAVDLNDRTQHQAASVEETTAMMHQITDRVTETSKNADQANQLASKARNQADEGAEIMRSTIESMGDIREASHKIEEIISLIDSIAFQTNLLALNAAVEAARAGEHGRGFAVVAGEVRSLAGKSSDAARDIKDLIENAVSAVDQGTERAKHSDEALQSIIESIREVSDLVAEISNASNEQSQSISQIGHAVSEIDSATQQNAALVEETTAASESMKDEASRLKGSVTQFKV